MDWNAKANALRAATIAAVDELLPTLDGERLYTIALQTDDGGMSVGPSANTEEGYAEKRESEAEVEEMTPDYEAYLRWAPAEWRHEMFGDGHFTAVNRDLSAEADDPEGGFDTYFEHLLDAMVDALANLRAERGSALEGVTLFATISDSEDAEDIENRSAKRLNPPELAAAFARRFG